MLQVTSLSHCCAQSSLRNAKADYGMERKKSLTVDWLFTPRCPKEDEQSSEANRGFLGLLLACSMCSILF